MGFFNILFHTAAVVFNLRFGAQHRFAFRFTGLFQLMLQLRDTGLCRCGGIRLLRFRLLCCRVQGLRCICNRFFVRFCS